MADRGALYRSIHDGAKPRRDSIDWPPEDRPGYAVDIGRLNALEFWQRTPRGLELTRHEVQGYDNGPDLVALDHGARGRSLAFVGGRYTVGDRGITEARSMKRKHKKRSFSSGHRIVRYNSPMFGTGPEARVVSDGLIVGGTSWAASAIASAMLERTNWTRMQKAGGIAAIGFLGGFLLARKYPRLALGLIVLGFVELGRLISGAVRVNAWTRQLAAVGTTTTPAAGAGEQPVAPPVPPVRGTQGPMALPNPRTGTYGGYAFNPWLASNQWQQRAA